MKKGGLAIGKWFFSPKSLPTLNVSGFSLVEMMVACAVGGGLMLAMSGMMNYQNKTSTGIRMSLSRDQIATNIAKLAGDPTALTNSANSAANSSYSMFKACVLGTVGTTCSAASATDFVLVNKAPTPTVITGTATTPLTYNVSGAICGTSAATTLCPITAYTSFTVICPTGGCVSGLNAASISITYTVSQSVLGASFGRLKTISGTITVPLPLTRTGTQNYFAKWITSSNMGTSAVSEDTLGNIGIGLTTGSSAQNKLDVNGTITAGGPTVALNGANKGNLLLSSNEGVNYGAIANLGSAYGPSAEFGVYLGVGVYQSAATTTSWLSSLTSNWTLARSALSLDYASLHLLANTTASASALGAAVAMTETFKFDLTNQIASKLGAASWATLSDGRTKYIHGPFLRGIDAIEQLSPVYFNYKKGNELGARSDIEYVGFVAQDVQKVIPEAISQDDRGFLHIVPDAIYWTMFNAIKALHQMLKGLTERVSEIETQKFLKLSQEEEKMAEKAAALRKQNQDLLNRLIQVEKRLQAK